MSIAAVLDHIFDQANVKNSSELMPFYGDVVTFSIKSFSCRHKKAHITWAPSC